MDMKKNEGQEAVINTTEGQLIVIACPGSGKTTTLVRRIHHMVADCNIPSESILMVTFSNAAAKEMRERYQKSYGKDDVTFSTIHSLCFAILRKFAGYSNEDILTDARDYFYKKLRGNKQVNDKEEFINSILTEISVIKNNQIPLDDYNPICCNDKTLFEDLFTGYEEYKNDLNVVDFDDMLIQAYQTMKDNKNCLQWLRNKYRYIQVDEYQDTNYLQRDIIYLLAGENGNLTVVGDDDQSIYGFRGARPQVMLNFKKDYPDAVMIRLSTNYRSSKEIIHSADNLIKLNKSRFDKEFLAFKSETGQIEYMPTPTREYEISKVTMKIKELLKSGEKPEDIAVLYRTNSQAEAVADSLLMANIPFHSNEKISNRYEHWMFYDIQAFYALANDNEDIILDIDDPDGTFIGVSAGAPWDFVSSLKDMDEADFDDLLRKNVNLVTDEPLVIKCCENLYTISRLPERSSIFGGRLGINRYRMLIFQKEKEVAFAISFVNYSVIELPRMKEQRTRKKASMRTPFPISLQTIFDKSLFHDT